MGNHHQTTMSYLLISPFNNDTDIEKLYAGTDTEDIHKANRTMFGKEWKYYDSNFTYKFNKYGYRMNKQLDQIDFDNYIAFFGCSYTVGQGLPLEDTFAWRIAQELGLGDNYINGAIAGSSSSFVGLNVIHLLKTAPKLPRAIIINWPAIHRLHYWYTGKINFMLPNFKPPTKPEWFNYWRNAYETTVVEESHITNSFAYLADTVHTMCRLAGIPLFQFSTNPCHQIEDNILFFEQYKNILNIPMNDRDNYSLADLDSLEVVNKTQARDLKLFNNRIIAHPGIAHQNNIVDKFLKEFK
jgi:hypothetical protein